MCPAVMFTGKNFYGTLCSMSSEKVYMDYAAATPVDPRVIKAMQKYQELEFGNPSSVHSSGVNAKRAVEDSRKEIASILNCQLGEIVFTSGGTEGDNMAIFGLVKSIREKYKGSRAGHVITTAIEHHAVLSPCKVLEKEGFDVTFLPVSSDGLVDSNDVKRALRPDTFLVSIMYANNEIGTVQPISEIAKVIRQYRSSQNSDKSSCRFPFFHTDACQAPGALPLNVARLGIDLMTISGAKIYGPKGIGVLYIKNGVPVFPMIHGGGQEGGLRSGTENVASIVGMAKALSLVDSNREKESSRLCTLRDYFSNTILKIVPGSKINGYLGVELPSRRLPNNLNIFIPDIDNEQLVIELDAIGVMASLGSACSANETTGSHVLWALYHDLKINKGTIRFTLGKSTTKKDIDYVLKSLPEILERTSS